MRQDKFEFHEYFLFIFLRSVPLLEKLRDNLFFSVEEVEILSEAGRGSPSLSVRRERAVASRDESSFWRTAESMFQHGLGAAFSAEKVFRNCPSEIRDSRRVRSVS